MECTAWLFIHAHLFLCVYQWLFLSNFDKYKIYVYIIYTYLYPHSTLENIIQFLIMRNNWLKPYPYRWRIVYITTSVILTANVSKIVSNNNIININDTCFIERMQFTYFEIHNFIIEQYS